jgi:hypothetical protein
MKPEFEKVSSHRTIHAWSAPPIMQIKRHLKNKETTNVPMFSPLCKLENKETIEEQDSFFILFYSYSMSN